MFSNAYFVSKEKFVLPFFLFSIKSHLLLLFLPSGTFSPANAFHQVYEKVYSGSEWRKKEREKENCTK